MSPSIGEKLSIRAMIYVAGEQVPFFWPMRSFIHHNPLHGLEHLPFADAVEKGTHLFHASGYLPRTAYQGYLAQGKIDKDALDASVRKFCTTRQSPPGLDLPRWLMTALCKTGRTLAIQSSVADPADVRAALADADLPDRTELTAAQLSIKIRARLPRDMPLYEIVDALYGTSIGLELDERVIQACLDFFDEGQSVWDMPERQRGFFAAWKDLAGRDVKSTLKQLARARSSTMDADAEGAIVQILQVLGVPMEEWSGYFRREVARLHGWAGFIRWRSSTKNYYWAQRYPGDLVDLVAVRMLLTLTLLRKRRHRRLPTTFDEIEQAITSKPQEMYLRSEFYGPNLVPALAHPVEDALLRRNADLLARVFVDYRAHKRRQEASVQAQRLTDLATACQDSAGLRQLSAEGIADLLQALRAFEKHEGMLWLQAMEAKSTQDLVKGISLAPPPPREKRPFVQALFCIDTRSERIRRHLEGVGDYQTYGIAGFFGVPVSFMELGKGSENLLCPVLLTPKNLVLEMTAAAPQDQAALSAVEKAMHELKESVLTPFVTVEAIGLLFGFDMVGKTLAPTAYNRLRQRLHEHKPATHLLLDKFSREQADSIVRAVQRAVIVKAVEQEFRLEPEHITDDMIRELRESALGHATGSPGLVAMLGLDGEHEQAFIERLRTDYRIEPSFAKFQLERLGRIGFSLDEQTRFVVQALRSIGLVHNFSRFVLLVGHGSASENNPYESALDCGACGGNHGLASARVLARMANKPEVRRRLRARDIDIADDAWFVPALHNTTTDEIHLYDLDALPAQHLIYLDRLRNGVTAAARLCAQERLPSLQTGAAELDAAQAARSARRNSMDWSQVRPEWGLSRNAFFVIGRRSLTEATGLDGRAFLHSYDYRLDPKLRLLENILSGPLVVAQWINMEHYFSTVDNERFGSGSKAYHNVAGRFGVMTGNLSDLRTGLPAQTVLDNGLPYHEPVRLITVIEAPFEHALKAVESVVSVKRLVRNGWVRLLIIDPETATRHYYDEGEWQLSPHHDHAPGTKPEEPVTT